MVGLAARDLGSRSDSDLQGSGNLAGPQKQLPLAVLGNVAPMLKSLCQQHQNWTEWFCASLLFHLRYLKLEAPTSTVYRFRLAGPTVCKPIQTVKRTSNINDGLNNVFIITETRATEDKWFSRWGDSEKNVSHVPHEANNVHEESKALL